MTGSTEAPGIIPRAISEIFQIIEQTASQEADVYFYVRLSYVELYNNNFRNLLDRDPNLASSGRFVDDSIDFDTTLGTGVTAVSASSDLSRPGMTDKIEVRESQSAGVFLAGPNLRLPVTSAHEAFQLISRGT